VKHRSTPRRNISAKSIVSPRRLWRATAPPGSPKPHESAWRPKRRGERPPNDALISPPHPRRKSDARRTERKTIEKARKAKREGKAPTTQAGEYVRVEIDKIRRGEHGARSPEQAIANFPSFFLQISRKTPAGTRQGLVIMQLRFGKARRLPRRTRRAACLPVHRNSVPDRPCLPRNDTWRPRLT